MTTKVFSSDRARAQWRDVIDTAAAGNNIVIERYGKPTVAIIPYEDFIELEELIEELRDARDTQVALAEWEGDPTTARPWDEVKAKLIADRLLDE